MENFIYQNPTKIIFGKDAENYVGNETKRFSDNALLHYDDTIKKLPIFNKVIQSLEDAGIRIYEFGGVKPNPRLSLVKEGIRLCRQKDINFILAIGGGSVMDSAKTIAAGVYYEGDVWNLFTERLEVKKALPIGVVVTIAGTGTETCNGAVITKEEGLFKRYINSDLIRPKFAILNPELTFTVPPYQTACGCADVMSHVMERYFTQVSHVDLTDRLCEATLKTVIKNTPMVLENPKDYNARAEIMWASTIAHSDFLSTGRIGDWACHNIEHEISALYDIPHGAGMTVVSPAWMKYVYKQNLSRFTQYAIRVWNIEENFESIEKTVLEGIDRTSKFFKQIGLPTTLHELNIPSNSFEQIATKSLESARARGESGPLGNFMKLNEDDIVNILKLANDH